MVNANVRKIPYPIKDIMISRRSLSQIPKEIFVSSIVIKLTFVKKQKV